MPRLMAAAAFALAALTLAPRAGADLAEIKARGTLRLIAVREEAPEMFSFSDTGEPGFEREIAEGFARLHDLKVQAVPAANAEERITWHPQRVVSRLEEFRAEKVDLDNLRKGPSWSRLVVKYFGEKALSVLGRK